jgi:hypothetical protein
MRRSGEMKYRRAVLSCVLAGAFLLMVLLVGCKADARATGDAGAGALPVATYAGTDTRGQTAREINEASTLPLPLLAPIDAFEPAGYEGLNNFTSKDYRVEDHALIIITTPTEFTSGRIY